MSATTEELVYTESVRAITQQEAALDSLRARTGTLLAAASLITAFLGTAALDRNQALDIVRGEPHFVTDLDLLAWTAIGEFVAVAILSLFILWPWTWVFSTSARVLIEDHVDVPDRNSTAQLHRFLALSIESHWDTNQQLLDRLVWLFRAASLVLVSEVVTWLIVLGRE